MVSSNQLSHAKDCCLCYLICFDFLIQFNRYFPFEYKKDSGFYQWHKALYPY